MSGRGQDGLKHANQKWERFRRRLARGASFDVVLVRHARDQMKWRGISEIDIKSCLRNGRVVKVDVNPRHARPAWRIEWSSQDLGCVIWVVIVEPDEDALRDAVMEFVVITCWLRPEGAPR